MYSENPSHQSKSVIPHATPWDILLLIGAIIVSCICWYFLIKMAFPSKPFSAHTLHAPAVQLANASISDDCEVVPVEEKITDDPNEQGFSIHCEDDTTIMDGLFFVVSKEIPARTILYGGEVI